LVIGSNYTPCRAAASRQPIANEADASVVAARAGNVARRGRGPLLRMIDAAVAVAPLAPVSGRRTGHAVDLRSGRLQLRLAQSSADIDAAQALRYRVFYEDLGARLAAGFARQRDVDRFDRDCDHLLVLDRARGPGPDRVVGTYRLIRRAVATRLGGFYSAGEYDIAPLVAQPGEILELGRSCVDAAYRQRPTLRLLWSGIAAYVFHYNIALMFGCASLSGTDPAALATQLAFLYHHHLAPAALRPTALPDRYVDMRRMPPEAIDRAAARAALPPLIKGYLRLGGFVGDGAVVDEEFNTTDVCIVVKTDLVTRKYSRHYRRQSNERWVS
jgi:putative hemolysin